jgi:hypothetical protein
MGLLRHHPSIGKLPCEGCDWRLSHPELDALIWREGEELAPRRGRRVRPPRRRRPSRPLCNRRSAGMACLGMSL